MKVSIFNRQNEIELDLALIKKVASYVADKFIKGKSTEVNIVFVNKDEIRELNKKYRNKNVPTDVLSFSYNRTFPRNLKDKRAENAFSKVHGLFTAGEIIICPEIALENISNAVQGDNPSFSNWNLNKEIALLVIHGFLHIFNYDHETKNDKINMESIQNSLLNDVFTNFGI